MRWFLSWLVLFTLIGASFGWADSSLIQEFTGTGSTTTAFFNVQDRWEVRWNATRVISIAVLASDGSMVAGSAGVLRGSLFLPLRGQYYLKISEGADPAVNGATPSLPPDPAFPVPTVKPATDRSLSWHLQVVQIGAMVASNETLTVYTPYFFPPDAALTPAPPPPADPKLTEEQLRAVVLVKGDNAQEMGFVVKMPTGYAVVTHLHFLAANPNVHVVTPAGAVLSTLGLQGASDRDVALLLVQGSPPSFLPAPTHFADTAQLGDPLLIPGMGPTSEILLGTAVKLTGIRPDRIDFGRPGDLDEGAPVIQNKSGTVLAITTSNRKVNLTSGLTAAWPENLLPGLPASILYVGLRFDNVAVWETYDPARFLAETLFLSQFHLGTRYLDSYLNGQKTRGPGKGDLAAPDDKFFLNSDSIKGANDRYRQMAGGGDRNQRYESGRELLFTLGNLADNDLARLQALNSPYTYDQTQAREELAYRQAIKKQLDNFGNNPAQLDTILQQRLADPTP